MYIAFYFILHACVKLYMRVHTWPDAMRVFCICTRVNRLNCGRFVPYILPLVNDFEVLQGVLTLSIISLSIDSIRERNALIESMV